MRGKEAVKFLRGAGGADTRTPEQALAEWREVIADTRQMLDALEAQGDALEHALVRLGEVLRKSQPPMYRTVSLRWWRLGGGRSREPTLVRTEAAGRGLVRPVMIGPNSRLRVDRGFGLLADVTAEVVATFWALRVMWRELRDVPRGVQKALKAGFARREKKIAQYVARLEALHAESLARLDSVGLLSEDGEPVDDATE